jgi:hypothetical protein
MEVIQTVGMDVVKGVLVPVIGMFLVWASAHLPAWIKTKVNNQQAAGVLERLSQLSMAVVQEVEQTVVAKLGDKADAASLAAARDQAVATLKSHLGDKGLAEMETVFGLQNQDAAIKMLITFVEQAVHTLNASQASTTTTVSTTSPAPSDPLIPSSTTVTKTTTAPATAAPAAAPVAPTPTPAPTTPTT